MIYLLVLLGFLFFAAVAMTIGEGLWSNTISFLCLMISGLAGALIGVPLGAMILEKAGQSDSNAWYFIFAGLWGVFALTLLLLRIMADKASQTQVRFLPLVDKIAGPLMGLAVAVMLTSFAAFTLLNAPIAAGHWKMSDASEGQRGAFQKAASPFFTVYKRFTEAEKIDP